MMKLNDARKILPRFAVGLGIYAKTTSSLRDSVRHEISMYRAGVNPLEPKQVKALEVFLERTK